MRSLIKDYYNKGRMCYIATPIITRTDNYCNNDCAAKHKIKRNFVCSSCILYFILYFQFCNEILKSKVLCLTQAHLLFHLISLSMTSDIS